MTQDAAPLRRGVDVTQAKVACILAHGRGQSPEDMDAHIVSRLSVADVAFVLPRAAGGSWYDARAVDALTAHTRGQLASSIMTVAQCMEAIPKTLPVVIAGFSQGACLAIEYTLRTGPWHGALVAFTGCRVGQAGDQRGHSMLKGLPVYLSGSDNDPWIPAPAFADATLDLTKAQARLRSDVFPGRAHEVSDAEVRALEDVLSKLAIHGKVEW